LGPKNREFLLSFSRSAGASLFPFFFFGAPCLKMRGAEEKKMKATYIWQMINQVGRYLLFFIFNFNFLWRFCAFLNKGSSKTPLKTFWENPCQKLLAKKVERKKNFFPVVFSHRFFLSRFWPFLCMRNPKTP
jgi:hypothetical protein